MRVAAVFPGQGTQTPGAGKPWRDDPAWSVVERAEAALGEPLAPLLLDEDRDLARTLDAQLAVLLTSLVVWEALRARAGPGHVVAFAGHSLGQVTALIAAGTLPFDDGIRFAARRAEATQAAADARPGRMAALLGATPEQAEAACAAAGGSCWLANDNAPGQVVVAGTPDGVDRAGRAAKELGVKRALALDVGGAFHTPLMAPAREVLVAALASVPFAPPVAPVVSNGDGEPYTDGDGWRERLADHVVVPVRWRASMERLAALGADAFVEAGPGGMIAGVARRTVPAVPVHGVAVPADLDRLPEVP